MMVCPPFLIKIGTRQCWKKILLMKHMKIKQNFVNFIISLLFYSSCFTVFSTFLSVDAVFLVSCAVCGELLNFNDDTLLTLKYICHN